MGKKKEKKKGHSRADDRRRGRRLGLWILGALILLFAFYRVDRTGPPETIPGTVVEMRPYTHTGGDQQATHTHQSAVLEYEGHTNVIQSGDRFRLGDVVTVEIQRGRFTGYPYYIQAGLTQVP